ncbi:hypothetical protein RRG08_022683 [Elysia crispata]|uniref:Uncharacterized protein n=1 Tax=Elysia crispata TaxID=231223 RepID=A0AAE0YK95_9GAST|nr:hypothetical protein RRG08_022683 [Elysia crispata]
MASDVPCPRSRISTVSMVETASPNCWSALVRSTNALGYNFCLPAPVFQSEKPRSRLTISPPNFFLTGDIVESVGCSRPGVYNVDVGMGFKTQATIAI